MFVIAVFWSCNDLSGAREEPMTENLLIAAFLRLAVDRAQEPIGEEILQFENFELGVALPIDRAVRMAA